MNMKERIEIMRAIEAANKRHLEDWKQAQEAQKPTITGILIDVHAGTASVATIEKGLDGYYKALWCDCIDITWRSIGGRRFCIVCDDEGLLKSGCRLSAIDSSGTPQLVGNLFVVQDDGEEDVRSLTPEEAVHVMQHTQKIIDLRRKEAFMILTDRNYC